jgi:hypothetical protein
MKGALPPAWGVPPPHLHLTRQSAALTQYGPVVQDLSLFRVVYLGLLVAVSDCGT